MTPEQLSAAIKQRLADIEEAQKITLRLCRLSGLVDGFIWPPAPRQQRRLYSPPPRSRHREPPLPFHSFIHKGAGHCRVCGQPVYGKEGSHLKRFGESKRTWHSVCVTSYDVMVNTGSYYREICLRQEGLCNISSEPIRHAEIDHAVPLYRIARDHSARLWYRLLRYWMLPNLQVINREAHVAKCAAEAKERAGARVKVDGQGAML